MIKNKTILITGGTGSFGKKFIEIALSKYEPKRIIVFSRDELKQDEVRTKFDDSRLSFFIGDVRNKDRLYRAFKADVDIVIHAAALKQVPACEYNPFEAIETNIIGAKNVIDAAIDCNVEKIIALSTDKAVNPINLYGATKLCAEKLFVNGNSYAGKFPTRFSCVRYGNVVGSRGSVIPLFLKQKLTGKITVTDKRMTRFWITLQQSVEFVIKCLDLMQGGEVFIPKIPRMGIMDLVKAIAPECEIEFMGIRPGEKLHELLLSVDEARLAWELEDMFIIQPADHSWSNVHLENGKVLDENFTYISNTNSQTISIEELRELIVNI